MKRRGGKFFIIVACICVAALIPLPAFASGTLPEADALVVKPFAERSTGDSPYRHLFTVQSEEPLPVATKAGKLQTPGQIKGEIGTTGFTNGKDFVKFAPFMMLPNTSLVLSWRNNTYRFSDPTGVQISPDGTIYIEYDADDDAQNTGAFVLRITSDTAKQLQDRGTSAVGKKTVLKYLRTRGMALTPILSDAPRGATLAVYGDTVMMLSGADAEQTLYRIIFPEKGKRYLARVKPVASAVISGNDAITPITAPPSNFTLVSEDTGYFVIPYSRTGGGQGAWYGYAVYQLKIEKDSIRVAQSPIILQSMLGDAGKGSDPVRSVTWNPYDQRLYVTSDGAWFSFDLKAFARESGVYATKSGNKKGNRVPIDISIHGADFKSKAGTPQLAFDDAQAILLNGPGGQLLSGV